MKRRLSFFFLVLLALLLLAGCGGGDGDGDDGESQSQSIGSNEADVVFTGGDGYSPDSNLVIATFSDVATGQATGAAVQSSPAKLASGARDLAFPVGALSQSSRREVRWISQFTQSCNYYEDSSGNKSTYYKKGYSYQNGYCGFASVLMGADYLLTGSTKPAAPATVGYSTETGRWIEGSVANAFMDDRYSKCGGTAGISYSDIPKFVEALGLYGARQFDKTNVETENWIKTALINDQPVIALVPYQGNACSGRNNKVSQAVFYGAGSITQKMMPCPELTYRHWVLVAEIDPNSVLIYDPDPFAMSEEAGIRRYTKESFLDVLPDTRSGKSGKPNMYRLCSSENDCKYEPEAFSTLASIELGVNHSYTASNSAPVVNPLVPQYSFEGSDLPAGLFLETEGRLVGMTTETGTFHPTITMRSVVNGVERVAAKVVELTVKAASGVQDKLEFAVHSILSRSTVGINYFLPLGMTPTLEPVTFSVVSGNLPPGLSLWNGSLVGKSTQSGTYSFDIEAATSTTSTTKSFTLNIDPATDNADQVSLPYLQGVNPSPVPGKDGQQFVALKGSGFSDGIRVRLEDTTFGGTFMKVPVSINSSGTEITLSANFTSNSAFWTATVIGPTGLESDTIQFSVVAPAVATTVRPAIWASSWSPPFDGNLEVTANYGAFSKGCSNADLSAVYAWYEDSGRKEHLGLDLRAPAETSVRAIAPGKVLNSGKLWNTGGVDWGDVVLVEHWTTRGETFTAAYGHINASVSAPQEIEAGTEIGTVYNLSSGPHLHFGIAQGSRVSVPGFSSFNNSSIGDCSSSSGEIVDPENFLHTRLPTALSPAAVTTPVTPTDALPGTASSPEPTTSGTTVALSWSGVSGATYYDLGVRDIATTQLVVNTTTSSPSYSASLVAGKQYRWNVAACNSAGCSSYTTALYFKTPGATVTTPASPTSPSPGTTSSPGPTTSGATVALSWPGVSGATYYDVGVRDIATGGLVVDTTTSTVNS